MSVQNVTTLMVGGAVCPSVMATDSESSIAGITERGSLEEAPDDLDERALELLREESQQRLNEQDSRIHFYTEAGFNIARTSVLVLGLVLSGVTVLLNQGLVSVDGLLAQGIVQFGVAALSLSVFFGTLGPTIVDYLAGRGFDYVNRDHFENVVIEKTSEVGYSRQELLVKTLDHQLLLSNANAYRVKFTRVTTIATFYLLFVGTAALGYGILDAV